MLLVIDPDRYRLAVSQAEANLGDVRANWSSVSARLERRSQLTSSAISNETREQAAARSRGQGGLRPGEGPARHRELNLERSEMRSTVDGFVTNLLVQAGEFAQPGRAIVAVLDGSSFYVAAYFEETKLPGSTKASGPRSA